MADLPDPPPPQPRVEAPADPDDRYIESARQLLAEADLLTESERRVELGVSIALIAVGLLVVLVLSVDLSGPDETPRFLSAVFTGLALTLAGTFLSWYGFKRERDFREWRLGALEKQNNAMMQGRQRRLMEITTANHRGPGAVSRGPVLPPAPGREDASAARSASHGWVPPLAGR